MCTRGHGSECSCDDGNTVEPSRGHKGLVGLMRSPDGPKQRMTFRLLPKGPFLAAGGSILLGRPARQNTRTLMSSYYDHQGRSLLLSSRFLRVHKRWIHYRPTALESLEPSTIIQTCLFHLKLSTGIQDSNFQ